MDNSIILKTNKGVLYNKPTFIFGTGSGGDICLKWLRHWGIEVTGFIDNADKITEKKGLPVIKPKSVCERQETFQIVIASSTFYREMEQQIERLCGLDNSKNIFNWGELVDDPQHDVLIENVFSSNYKKRCLISYITIPFLEEIDLIMSHQNKWQVYQLAKELDRREYQIDAMRYDARPMLAGKYDLIIDMLPTDDFFYRGNIEDESHIIAYMTTSNPRVNNERERERITYLEARRSVSIPIERRYPRIGKRIEDCSAFFFVGNKRNISTYDEFDLPPVYILNNHGYPFPYSFDWRKKKTTDFLFIAGGGAVHKGLDILLEVFSYYAEHCRLFICGSFNDEKEFVDAYKEELKKDNIRMMGYVDVGSELFQSILDTCCYMIMPSCAEGMPGSVLIAMSAGLIPIVSKECGIEEDEAIVLEDCNMTTVAEAVDYYSRQELSWVAKRSKEEWDVARAKYMPENYLNSIYAGLDEVLQ